MGKNDHETKKNCQIGHQSGNFGGIPFAGGRSVALMDQVHAHTIVGILSVTVEGFKMGVKGEKWGENGPRVAKMAKLVTMPAIKLAIGISIAVRVQICD